MLDPVTRLSLSPETDDRVRAARLVARQASAGSDVMVLRLLRDTRSTAVSEAMARSLLRFRREAAIPLILRALGQDIPAVQSFRDHFDATNQVLLESLLDSELDNVEVRETIVHVLLSTEESHETVGALEAIGWIAPSGGFPASETALAHVDELSDHADQLVRGLARKAREALAEP
jgi:hypothetical protein